MKDGWVELRVGKSGTSFRARYWAPDANGELIAKSKSFHERTYGSRAQAKAAAETFLAQMMVEVRTGAYLAPSTTTLKQLTETWLNSKDDISHNTYRSYAIALKKLLPAYGNMPVQQIKPLHIQKLYNELRASQTGAGTLYQLHVVLKASLAQAVNWEVITRNPVAGVATPTVKAPPVSYWTAEQLAAFLQTESAHETYGMFWHVLIATGMRSGEARALRWTDVDIERRTITITRTVTRAKDGGEYIREATKTRNSKRTIPLPVSCLEPIAAHRARQRVRELAAASWDRSDGDLIFTNDGGRFLNGGSMRVSFDRAVERAGLPAITLHGLRHSYATDMLRAGVHPKVVSTLLGDTVEMVLRVYSHVTQESQYDAALAFDARIARLREDLPMAEQG